MTSASNYSQPAGNDSLSLTFQASIPYSNSTAADYGADITITTSPDIRRLYKVAGSIQAAIAILGIALNVLNIYVLVKLVSRRRAVSPTYHLLIAMGVADVMALFFMALFMMSVYAARKGVLLFHDLSDDHADYYHVLHYTWLFPTNVFIIASNWLIVATTFFRFLAVVFPMKVGQWCTLLRVRISIVAIFIMAIIINIPDFTTIVIRRNGQGNLRGNDTLNYNNMTRYYQFYPVMEIYLPFVIDLVLVICLIVNLNSTPSSLVHSIQDGNTNAARKKEHRKISIMLIAIVLWFLVCNIAYLVYAVMKDTSGEKRATTERRPFFKKFTVLYQFGPILNHTANIILYCLCNNTYRKMFVDILLCRKPQRYSQSQGTSARQLNSRYDNTVRTRGRRWDSNQEDSAIESMPLRNKKDNSKTEPNGNHLNKKGTVDVQL